MRKLQHSVRLALEPRLVFDAAAAATVAETATPADAAALDALLARFAAAGEGDPSDIADGPAHGLLAALAGTPRDAGDSPTAVLFVDSRVQDYQSIVDAAPAGTAVFVLDAQRSGVEQIAEALANLGGVQTLHIVSHGSAGELRIGSDVLDGGALEAWRQGLAAWGEALDPGADILLYGCDIAAGEQGARFLDALSSAIGDVDVAASTDATGAEALGGDWVLEAQTGPIEADALQIPAYEGLLAVPRFTIVASGDGITTTAVGPKATGTGNDLGNAMVVQPDGKVLVAGYSDSGSGSGEDFLLLRYNDDGSLDTGFGTLGKVVTDMGSTEDRIESIVLQPDGKIVVAGYTTVTPGVDTNVALARYNPDGSLDNTFGTAGKLVLSSLGPGLETANSVALDSSGNILVGGSSRISTDTDFLLLRLLPGGGLDTTFSGDGIFTDSISAGSTDVVHKVLVQPDGKIVAVGLSNDPANTATVQDMALLRVDSSGNLDTAFDVDGKLTVDFAGTNDAAYDAVLDASGNIVLAGSTVFIGGIDFAVARVTSTGQLDTSFSADGLVRVDVNLGTDFANAIALQADGSLVVAGYAEPPTGTVTQDIAVLRLDSLGNLDAGFSGDGTLLTAIGTSDERATAVALAADGSVWVAGHAYLSTPTGDNSIDVALLRYTSSGALDTGFGGTVISTLDGLATYTIGGSAVVLDADVQVRDPDMAALNGGLGDYAGATLSIQRSVAGPLPQDVFSFSAAGALFTVASPFPGSGELQFLGQTFATWTTLSGNLTINFTSSGTPATQALVNDVLRHITYSSPTGSPGSVQIRWSFSDGSSSIVGNSTVTLQAPAGNSPPTFAPVLGGDGIVSTDFGANNDYGRQVLVQPDGKILVGGSATTTGWRFGLARYTADGALDSGFDGDGKVVTSIGASAQAEDMLLQPDGKIVLVGDAQNPATGSSDFALVRYNADGSLDQSFGTLGRVLTGFGTNGSALDEAEAAVLQADGKILVAGYSSANGDYDFAIVRYNVDGTLDTTFGSGGKVLTAITSSTDIAFGIAVQADGRIVVTGSTYNGSNSDVALVRYNADGTLDATFGTAGKVTVPVGGFGEEGRDVAVQSDGKIVVAGITEVTIPDRDFLVLRFNSDGTPDATFNGSGIVVTPIGTSTDEASELALQADGKILVTGYASGTGDQLALVRYNTDGTLDTGFSGDGKVSASSGGTSDWGRGIAVQSDGRILVAGQGTSGVFQDFVLLRFTPSGNLDPAFDGLATNTLDGAPTFIIGGASVVLDANVQIGDAELAALNGGLGNYAGASLTIARNGGASIDDVLSFATAGASFTVAGANLQAGGLTFATFSSSSGSFTINFTGSATPATQALVNDVLQRIAYANSAGSPPSSVQLDWSFSDGSSSATGSTTVTILSASTVLWDGGAGTSNWGDAANWSTDILPTAIDDVVITGATVTLSTGSYAVNTLTITGGQLTIGGGTLTVGDAITDLSSVGATSQVLLSSGTLTLGGYLTVAGSYAQAGGTLGGAGTLALTGSTNTWGGTSGSWSGGGTVLVANGAVLSLSGTGVGNVFGGRTLDIAAGGTVNVAGSIELDPGTNAITNAGTLNLNSGDIRHTAGSQGAISITNTGVINKNNANTFILGSTPVEEVVNLSSSGTFNLLAGTLDYVGGSGSSTGTFTVASGATYQTSGNALMVFGAGSTFSSAGTILTTGGSATFSMPTANFTQTGSITTSGGAVTFTPDVSVPTMTLSGGTMSFNGMATTPSYTQTGGTLGGSGTLTLTGSTNTWSGTSGRWSGNGTVVITDGAVLSLSGTGVGNVFGGRTLSIAVGGTVNIAGSIELDPGTNAITNSGTLNLNAGDIRHTASSQGAMTISNTGVISKNTASTFTIGTTVPAEAVTLSNAGSLAVSAGNLVFNSGGGGAGLFSVSAGAQLALGGTWTLGSPGNFSGPGAISFVTSGQVNFTRGATAAESLVTNFVAALGPFLVDPATPPTISTTNGSVVYDGTNFAYTPTPAYLGPDSFAYTIRDTSGGITGTVTLNITVNPAGSPPAFTLLDGTPSYTEGGTAVVLDTDVQVTDPEMAALNSGLGDYGGATLTIVRSGGASAEDVFSITPLVEVPFTIVGNTLLNTGNTVATFSSVGGTLTINFTNSGTPVDQSIVNGVLQSIAYANSSISPPPSVTLGWVFSDGINTATGATTVAITALNAPPVAGGDSATVLAGQSVTIAVLANDSDADGGTLAVVELGLPANGAAVLNGDGTVTYTPSPGFSGADSFSYTLSDGQGGTATATVSVTVDPLPNVPPVAGGDSATVLSGQSVTIAVLANDSDADGGTLSVSAVGAPSNGTVVLNGDDTVTYTPSAGFSGADSFSYTLSDGQGGTATATVSVTVDPLPIDPPEALADTASTAWGRSVDIDALANDRAGDDGALVFGEIGVPAHGTVSVVDGVLRYTPAPGFTGTDSFGYTIVGADGQRASATVTIDVTRAELRWTNAGGDGDWNNPENWDQRLVPTPIDRVVLEDLPGSIRLDGSAQVASLEIADQLELDSGTLEITGEARIGAGGVLRLQGGELLGRGSLRVEGELVLEGATVSLALDNRGVVVAGESLLDFGGSAWTNDGVLRVPAGQTLRIVAESVLNRGLIQGHGTLDVQATAFINSGNVSPGSSPGVLSFLGDFTQTAAGTLTIEVGGNQAGVSYDQLVVSGTATLDGTLSFVFFNGYLPQPGDSLQILRAASVSGGFATQGGLPPGYSFNLSGGFTPAVTPTVPVVSGPVTGVVVPSVETQPVWTAPEPELIEIPGIEDWLEGDEAWMGDIDELTAVLSSDWYAQNEETASDDIATDVGPVDDSGEEQAQVPDQDPQQESENVDGPTEPVLEFELSRLEEALKRAAEGFDLEQRAILEILQQAEALLKCE